MSWDQYRAVYNGVMSIVTASDGSILTELMDPKTYHNNASNPYGNRFMSTLPGMCIAIAECAASDSADTEKCHELDCRIAALQHCLPTPWRNITNFNFASSANAGIICCCWFDKQVVHSWDCHWIMCCSPCYCWYRRCCHSPSLQCTHLCAHSRYKPRRFDNSLN